MRGTVGTRTKGETKLSLSIHRDATQLFPIPLDKLNTDAMVPGRCDMLQDFREGISFYSIRGKSYLSHGLPVVKSPVDGFIVLNSHWGYFLYVNTFCIAPDVDRGSCTAPDPVGGIAPSSQSKYFIFLLRPVTEHRQSEFDKSSTDVQVQALAGGDGEVCPTSVIVTRNLIYVSKCSSTGGAGRLPW